MAKIHAQQVFHPQLQPISPTNVASLRCIVHTYTCILNIGEESDMSTNGVRTSSETCMHRYTLHTYFPDTSGYDFQKRVITVHMNISTRVNKYSKYTHTYTDCNHSSGCIAKACILVLTKEILPILYTNIDIVHFVAFRL